jgi:hypothetical protein
MPAKKLPWRTLVTSEGPVGRFTREQMRRAIIAAEAERPARPARTRKRGCKAPGAQPRIRTAPSNAEGTTAAYS